MPELSDANSLSKGEARAEASRKEEGACCVPGKARGECGGHRKARGVHWQEIRLAKLCLGM